MRPTWWLLVLALPVLLFGCASAAQESPEAVAEGALRSDLSALVAPAAYRSGTLSASLAQEWIGRAETEYRRWYTGEALEQHLRGLRNVVGAVEAQPGSIVSGVDVQRLVVGAVSESGDTAHVDQATIWYVQHLVPGTWTQAEIPGVTMCDLDLRRVQGEWRVERAACNVSGG